jgi:hypothetical protein
MLVFATLPGLLEFLDFSLFQNVIPAQAGIQKFFLSPSWIPACAGMTWVER